jgi:hypothetical protein
MEWNGIDVSASWILVTNFDMMCMSVHKNIFRVRTRSQSNTTQWRTCEHADNIQKNIDRPCSLYDFWLADSDLLCEKNTADWLADSG